MNNLIEKVLSQSATQTERRELDDWLNESEENREHFEKVKVIWAGLDGVYSKADFNKTSAKLKISSGVVSRIRKSKQTKLFVRISVAASILLLIGISWLSYNYLIPSPNNIVVYSSGNTVEEFILNDGSQVWLNANSTLSVSKTFAKNDRTVFLCGEAYFEVTKDATKPFKVKAANTVTKVLGTKFNVRLDSINGNVDVDLLMGNIAFYKSGILKQKVILKAGEQACYNSETDLIHIPKQPDINYLAWKTKFLVFNESKLSQVCYDLSRCYGINIRTNIDNDNNVLTANFRNETIEDILTSIAISLDLKVDIISGQYQFDNK